MRAPKPPKPKVDRVRLALFKMQAGVCHYCATVTVIEHWTVDHKVPTSRGGSNHFINKVGACFTCNHAKGNLTEAEFRACPPQQRKERQKEVAMAQRTLRSLAELDAALERLGI